jgi:hypothetical protein
VFTTPATLVPGAHKIKVWVSHVNSFPETNHVNDTTFTDVYVASKLGTRKALVEEFTSSTCNPCATLDATFDTLLAYNKPNTSSQVNVVKYQLGGPSPGNDPSYNSDALTRRVYYKLTTIPKIYMNGMLSPNRNQVEIDSAKKEFSFVDIFTTLKVSDSTKIMAMAIINPYVSSGVNSPLKVFEVLTQKHYHYPDAVTSQKEYYHVMRKMNPNGKGTKISTLDGTPKSLSFTYTSTISPTPAQNTFDFWTPVNGIITYEYVVFVQDTVSNQILNSSSSYDTVKVSIATAEKNIPYMNGSSMGVYPKPANEFAVVGLKLSSPSDVDLFMYDINGKEVYTHHTRNVMSGESQIKINTSDFAAGMYRVVVRCNQGLLKENLIIAK